MKMAAFWIVAPCSLIKFTSVSQVFAASVIRVVFTLLETTWRYNPEDNHLHTHCHQNLKSYLDFTLFQENYHYLQLSVLTSEYLLYWF
jgi:hypothetical protein